MKKIFKYKIEDSHITSVEMPQCAEILCVKNQSGVICIWAIVEENATYTKRYFECYATGMPLPDAKRSYIGTVLLDDGLYVLHIFELIKLI